MLPSDHPVLVAIDADATWLTTLTQTFATQYTVIPCQTLEAGYAAIQAQHPSVVTIDLVGPFGTAWTGMQFLPGLRELPGYEHMAICGMSAPAQTRQLSLHNKLSAFAAGADAYYVKGLSLDSLSCSIHLLAKVVRRYGHQRYNDAA